MKPHSNNSDILISKYFRDELSVEESKAFQTALKDSAFRSEVEFQATTLSAILESRRSDLDKLLVGARKELGTDEAQEGLSPVSKKNKWLILSFFLISALCLSLYLVSNSNSSSRSEQIYLAYYKPYDTPEQKRGTSNEVVPSFEEAMTLYESQEYSEALAAFGSIDPQTESISLLSANCHMNLKNWESAKALLTDLQSAEDLKISQHADWYLSLCYLKMDNEAAAEKLFSKMESGKHLYGERIKDIRQEYGL